MLNSEVCEAQVKLIEKLTRSAKGELYRPELRDLLKLSAQSEKYVIFCHDCLMQTLNVDHAEIRMGTVLIISELFCRSEFYRNHFLENDFYTFISLTLEIDVKAKKPLQPIQATKQLQLDVYDMILSWNDKFGDEHPDLSTACHFIKHNLELDLHSERLQREEAELEEQRMSEMAARVKETLLEDVMAKIRNDVCDIQCALTEVRTGFSLLFPETEGSPEPAEPSESESDSDQESPENPLRLISSMKKLKAPESDLRVRKNEHTEALLENLKGSCHLIKSRLVPKVTTWINQMKSAEGSPKILSRLSRLNEHLKVEVERFNKLKIIDTAWMDGDSDTSDEEFEEVEDEHYGAEPLPVLCVEPSEAPTTESALPTPKPIPPKTDSTIAEWKDDILGLFDRQDNDHNDPTTLSATLHKLLKTVETKAATSTKRSETAKIDTEQPGPSSLSQKEKLLSLAPKVPIAVDLYHGRDPLIYTLDYDGNEYWQSDRKDEDVPDGLAAIQTRTVHFTGAFEPVKWSCRAPFSNGKLCPRMDRFKCPLHGKIIGRDEKGQPTDPEEIKKLETKRLLDEQNKVPDWQDPKHLEELKAKLGVDLTITKPKRGKRKLTFAEKYPGLTDITKKVDDPRARLAKKVCSKKSLEKIRAAVQSHDRKLFNDKYGDQFNYAMFEND